MSNLPRALAYLEKLPRAVSGSGGHAATWQAVLACRRFGLDEAEMWEALQWFNANRCDPPWSERELRHKLMSADKINVQNPMAARSQGRNWHQSVKPVGALPPIGPVGFAPHAAELHEMADEFDRAAAALRDNPSAATYHAYATLAARLGLPFYNAAGQDDGAAGWRVWASVHAAGLVGSDAALPQVGMGAGTAA